MNVQLQTIQEKLLDRKMFRLGDIEQLVQSHTAMNDDIQKKIRNAVANGKHSIKNIVIFQFTTEFEPPNIYSNNNL